MRQKRLSVCALCAVVCIVAFMHCSIVYTEEVMSPGSRLPEFKLNMPDSPSIDAYLEMKGMRTFFWSQIPAKLILIEFFSVFCPKCQENAPTHNRLYKIIMDDKELSKDIRMIGIALSSQSKQVDVFKEKFKVGFPLFADLQGEIQAKTKVSSVPLTLLVDKSGKVIMSYPGIMKDLDAFLLELRRHHKAL